MLRESLCACVKIESRRIAATTIQPGLLRYGAPEGDATIVAIRFAPIPIKLFPCKMLTPIQGRSSVVEQRPFKPKVVGSIPTAPTSIFFLNSGLWFFDGPPRAAKFDPETRPIFNSLGEGSIAVFRQDSSDRYTPVENIQTAGSAKTTALDSKTHCLFVPSLRARQFTILVFDRSGSERTLIITSSRFASRSALGPAGA
jgi:hypothetical protein